MRSRYLWCLAISLILLVTGCSTPGKEAKKPPAHVAAAVTKGDLTYQDVLQKGEMIHGVSMTSDASQIWIGTHSGLYVSGSNGMWASFSKELEQEDVTGWFVDPEQPEHIYVSGSNLMKKSTDSGKSWQKVETGLQKPVNIRALTGVREGKELRLFAFVSGEGVYQSTDEGNHWKLWLPLDQEVYAMSYNENLQRIYVATQYGLLYNDKDQWAAEQVANAEQVYSLAISADGTMYVATEQGIMQKSGNEWSLMNAKAPEKLIVIASGEGEHTLTGVGESAFIYTLNKEQWTKWK